MNELVNRSPMKRTCMALAAVACFALIAPVAHAQAQGDARKEAKERKDDKKEGEKKKEAALDAAAASSSAEHRELPKPTDTKQDRAERRRRAIALTRARWGALVVNPPAQAELRLHARRIAKIDAMEQVARASGKTDLLPRIANLRVKENARFEMRMDYVKNEIDGGFR